MKTLIFVLISGVMLFACQSTQDKAEKGTEPVAEKILEENKATVMLHIDGMTCTGCENTITSGLESLPGVIQATASHIDSNAVVQYDKTKVAIEDLKKMVEKKGYTYVASSPVE